MYQRARAEKSEVQDLIYGGSNTSGANSKNFMKQNHDEMIQKQRQTQQLKEESNRADEEKRGWMSNKYKDVKPKLTQTGLLNDENTKQPEKQVKYTVQDKTKDQAPALENKKLTKAEKFKQMQKQNKPLNEHNQNSKEPIKQRSALQSAGEDMINSKPLKVTNAKPKQKPEPVISYKVGANNPPPAEQPNVVHYTAESNEDIFALVNEVDPNKEHRDRYAPRNIGGPRKKATKVNTMEETKLPRKGGNHTDKGFIAPKTEKNFLKTNKTVKGKGTVQNKDDEVNKPKNFGKVPNYLQKYNKEAQMKKDYKVQMEVDKDVPAGCKRMDESERLATLKDLNGNKHEINTMLEKLPISMRTQSLTQRKNELEDKLAEIDRAISMFSKKVVYVAM
jgi:hypothetical protein